MLNIRQAGEERRRGGEIYLDTQTGQEIKARETRGGAFLYRFHFELYGMPRIWGRWIVGIATLLMFVAIISGIITHKRFSKISLLSDLPKGNVLGWMRITRRRFSLYLFTS